MNNIPVDTECKVRFRAYMKDGQVGETTISYVKGVVVPEFFKILSGQEFCFYLQQLAQTALEKSDRPICSLD